VWRGFDVDGDVVGARLREVCDVTLGAVDHQVDIDERTRGVDLLGERVDDQRAHADRRHEVPVHDVDVDGLRARVEHRGDLLGEAREVGREDGGGDPSGRHIGWSMELRQWLQTYSAVSDMRTIVECSPQLGHTEHSSKRCRQFTQR
jgi:hypothetical protein